jgi:hypothetical protein
MTAESERHTTTETSEQKSSSGALVQAETRCPLLRLADALCFVQLPCPGYLRGYDNDSDIGASLRAMETDAT